MFAHNDLNFQEGLLYSTPTEEILLQAKLLVQRDGLNLEHRKLLNDWIEIAQTHVEFAGGLRGRLLDRYRPVLPEVNTIECCVQSLGLSSFRKTLEFPYAMKKAYVLPIALLKASAFGKIKKGCLLKNQPPSNKFEASINVAIKSSNINLANAGRRMTGETVFEDAEKEIAAMTILSKFNHPYVLKLLMTGKDESRLFTVCPLGKTSLWDKLQHNYLSDIIFLARVRQQIGSALAFIHAMGFVHRDVSLENIIEMDDGTLQLIDFGLCLGMTLVNNTDGEWMDVSLDLRNGKYYCVGKMRYLAPEIFLRNPGQLTYNGPKADVFGLGICIFMLVYRTFPFNIVHPNVYEPTADMLLDFWKRSATPEFWQTYVKPPIQWLDGMICMSSHDRLSARDCAGMTI